VHEIRALATAPGISCAAAIALACGGSPGSGGVADAGIDADCPAGALAGPGRHRLFVQGHQAEPNDDGSYPFLHDHRLCDDTVFTADENGDGVWQPGETPLPLGPAELVHGEHFLVGVGSYAEFTIPLCDDVGPSIVFYVPNYDETGSRALHQLVVARGADESLIAEAIDEEAGQSGYNPFVRAIDGDDPAASRNDRLLLRSTNLNGIPFSVMVWQPPSEYESWIVVEVP
jgi:hypothetical protein